MKKIIYLILFLALLFGGYNVWRVMRAPVQPPVAQQSKIQVREKIVLGETGEFKEYEVASDTTALELLQQTAQVKVQGEGTNAFVTEINGRAGDVKRKEYWSFNLNGSPAGVGAGSYSLQEGDQIEWKIVGF